MCLVQVCTILLYIIQIEYDDIHNLMVHQVSTSSWAEERPWRSRDTSQRWWHLGAAWWAQEFLCQRANGWYFCRSSNQKCVVCGLQRRRFDWATQDAALTLGSLFLFLFCLLTDQWKTTVLSLNGWSLQLSLLASSSIPVFVLIMNIYNNHEPIPKK